MNEILLPGCAPTSLSHYLKAMGVFKLHAEQSEPELRAFWRDDRLVLLAEQAASDVEDFFLHSYRPTPIISPWNGRAGFLEGDDGVDSTRKGATTLRAVKSSSGHRLARYRQAIDAIEKVSVIAELDRVRSDVKSLETSIKRLQASRDEEALLAAKAELAQRKKEAKRLKDGLLLALRAQLDDDLVRWIDACLVITGGEGRAAPLLGLGGNEGSMDFSINHVATLLNLIDPDTDAPSATSAVMLGETLFGKTQHLDLTSNIGFLGVGAAGGVNMTSGFDAKPSENPWTSVLVLEGAMLFAASATKKLESGDKAGLSFPFMVSPTLAGSGSIGKREGAKPELWLPVWNAPASLNEVAALMAEGRSTLGRRQVRSGLDMLESLSALGTHRGIGRFVRFGFFERRGRGYFVASHLGSYGSPKESAESFIARDLGHGRWMSQLAGFADGPGAAARYANPRRLLEDRLFQLAGRQPSAAETQSLLILLGEIQHALSNSAKAREAVAPIPRLTGQWVAAADDGTPEFRIALALAGLRGVGDAPLPLRSQIFPVQRQTNQWSKADDGEEVRLCIGRRGRLVAALNAWFERRLWLMAKLEMRDKPLGSAAGATLADVASFLHDPRMDSRIAALLPGLSLCDVPPDGHGESDDGTLPAAFGLMKLALTTDRDLRSIGRLAADEHLSVPAGLLALLRAGNPGNRASSVAWRRLRASGLTPAVRSPLPTLAGIDPARAAAALLIPLRRAATAALARSLLDEAELTTAAPSDSH